MAYNLKELSGAMERGIDIVYVCYDNEAYMNTGIQRSSSTQRYAETTTSAVGAKRRQAPKQKGPHQNHGGPQHPLRGANHFPEQFARFARKGRACPVHQGPRLFERDVPLPARLALRDAGYHEEVCQLAADT